CGLSAPGFGCCLTGFLTRVPGQEGKGSNNYTSYRRSADYAAPESVALPPHFGIRHVRLNPGALEPPKVNPIPHPQIALDHAHNAGEPKDTDERICFIVTHAL